MNYTKIKGIVAAMVTPFNEDDTINFNAINELANLALENDVSVFINGTTAEWASLTVNERKSIAEYWRNLIPRDSHCKVIVHVGSCCLKDAEELARHARDIGADAFSAVCPFYHKPKDIPTLVKSMEKIAKQAVDLPFYYYHFPGMTGVNFSMATFFRCAENVIPNLVGLKFTHQELGDLHECSTLRNGYYNLLLGDDTALGPALMAGADGAIGSTYGIPYMLPIYKAIVSAFKSNDMETLRNHQTRGIEICRIYAGPGKIGISHLKHILRMCGYQVGIPRLPLPPLTKEEETTLETQLKQFNFI